MPKVHSFLKEREKKEDMNLTHLWRNAQSLKKRDNLSLNEWYPQHEGNDCTIILSPDEEFYPLKNTAMQHYFWNYIEHRKENPVSYRKHQLGYVWFTKNREKKGIFSIPGYAVDRDPDYETMILKRTEEIAGFLRTRFDNVHAGILHGRKIEEIILRESLITLFAPEEIMKPNYDPDIIGKIERFIP